MRNFFTFFVSFLCFSSLLFYSKSYADSYKKTDNGVYFNWDSRDAYISIVCASSYGGYPLSTTYSSVKSTYFACKYGYGNSISLSQNKYFSNATYDEHVNYIKGTQQYADLIAEATTACDGTGGSVQAYIGDGWKFADGLLKTTDCSGQAIQDYTINYIQYVKDGEYKDYDGSDSTKDENFLKAIMTDVDEVTGEFTMATGTCEGVECRVDNQDDAGIPTVVQGAPDGCVTDQAGTKMYCVDYAPEINRVTTEQGATDKLIIDNATKDLVTETEDSTAIANASTAGVLTTVDTFTSSTGGGDNGGDGGDTGGGSGGDTGGGSGGTGDGGDGGGDTNPSTDDILDALTPSNGINESNTQSFEASMQAFHTRIMTGSNIFSSVYNFSLTPKAGSQMQGLVIDSFTVSGVTFDAVNSNTGMQLIEDSGFKDVIGYIAILGYCISALLIILKL